MTIVRSDVSPPGLRTLSALHRKLIRYMLAGMRNDEIASLTGLTSTRVSALRCSPLIKSRMAEIQADIDAAFVSAEGRLSAVSHADVAKRISSEQLRSVDTIVSLREGAASEHVRLRASADLLDRGGHSSIQRSLNVSAVVKADGTVANLLRVMANDKDAAGTTGTTGTTGEEI